MIASDEYLLAQVARGDVAAFGEFYDLYSARVLGLLTKMLGRTDDAEDVLQEAFWQVWSTAQAYDPARASPAAWLFMIARSRACDALRRERVRSNEPLNVEPPAADPWQLLEQDETCQTVLKALAQLPDEQRSAVQLAFYGGMTHAEVATIQGVPLGTAKTRIRLAIMRLRVLLGEREKVTSS